MKRMRVILVLTAILAVALAACAFGQTGNGTVEPPNTGGLFTDVPKDHWAYEDLQYLNARGIIVGLPGGRYNGDTPMDRYTAAAMIARAIKYMQNNPESVTPQDLNVLKDLIFNLSDSVDAIRAQPSGDTSALAGRIAANERAIADVNARLAVGSQQDVTSLAKRVQANFIISLTALLVGIIGVALATLGL